MAEAYRCLHCGSREGTPTLNNAETAEWFWRTYPNGRVGPFHSEGCEYAFRQAHTSGLLIEEIHRLEEVRYRLGRGTLADDLTPDPLGRLRWGRAHVEGTDQLDDWTRDWTGWEDTPTPHILPEGTA